MFIQTQKTPNPNAIKFFPEIGLISQEPVHFDDIEKASKISRLASKLLSLKNVDAVFFGNNFITIVKSGKNNATWDILKPEVLMVMIDHFAMDLPIFEEINNFNNNSQRDNNFNNVNISKIEEEIIELINTRVRPSVAMDGGDIEYIAFQDGVVHLKLRGACSGCPSASITLKDGIESMLQHFIPEVQSVEAAED
ncbi:MAG: NifU family protein [Rickettsiaceae bacterium]